jgi:NAD(P)H-hydrate epimerase
MNTENKQAYTRLDASILQYLPVRKTRSHKGTYGKVLCIAGSVNMAGAAYLCAYAAYRTGAGLVRIFTPEANRVILQTLLPEAILTTFVPGLEEERRTLLGEALSWADAVACGPGLGKETWAKETVKQVLLDYHGPLVLDADAINHLSENPELLKKHKETMILTPHVGEFARLTGQNVREVSEQIPEQALQYACSHNCICVLKDAPTAIGSPDGQCFINTTGNNGMSTGGSGDVLTGIIAGLLGQKAESVQAALLGVWLHGRAGDLAAEKEGTYGLLARHLIEYLPGAMKK